MRGMFQGWLLVGTMTALIALALLFAGAAVGFDTTGLRLMIRITARTSLLLFGLAFTASALVRLVPSRWTRWQMRNRRYLGVSLAASHVMHLLAILGYMNADPEAFWKYTGLTGIVGGSLGYIVLAAMTATSFDRSAAALGPRAWKAIHTAGSYYLWIVFAFSFLPRSIANGFYWPFAAFTVALLLIRIMGAIARGRTGMAPAQ